MYGKLPKMGFAVSAVTQWFRNRHRYVTTGFETAASGFETAAVTGRYVTTGNGFPYWAKPLVRKLHLTCILKYGGFSMISHIWDRLGSAALLGNRSWAGGNRRSTPKSVLDLASFATRSRRSDSNLGQLWSTARFGSSCLNRTRTRAMSELASELGSLSYRVSPVSCLVSYQVSSLVWLVSCDSTSSLGV